MAWIGLSLPLLVGQIELSLWWRCASVQFAFPLTCSFATMNGEYAWDGNTVAWEWWQPMSLLVSGEAIRLQFDMRLSLWDYHMGFLSKPIDELFNSILGMIEEWTSQRLWERARDSDLCQCWMPQTQSHTSICLWKYAVIVLLELVLRYQFMYRVLLVFQYNWFNY